MADKAPKSDVSEAEKELDLALYEEQKPPAPKIQFINFLLGKEWYGVEISHVSGVCRLFTATHLPCAPDYIGGIVNLRGNILSITDLKKIFGLPATPSTQENRIVVLQSGGFETGIIVDKISNVVDVELAKIDPPLETLEPDKAEFIIGECKLGETFFAILNVEKIFALRGRQEAAHA